ncbi:LacI family transcriptional regulator [Actinoplanes lobatus]|uniref:LacI family transcriptional regulator n=1 Tax=Actinoplanes lobatus TaxID=113568 RepID=A0A7W7HL59_9ACTN|nr:LacI family DNA-binding transcriptional regulator [Actinoplanes lobatus]MBB4752571.1 LacI family transcriptional regulator [Actinoplanes lobatus]GGN97905.1 LacI family transcriptional regulator [Actinoplanes lobatus]GIE45847.1 LacI family transcriptional regulator [Actinoplanes lobatus]
MARHAGVSTTAVSKVLRNAYGTSPQMHRLVRAAVDQLGYRPSAAARALRGRTWTVGVMLPDVRNPFFADILDGVAEHLDGSEYQVLMTSGCNDAASEARVTEAMIDRSMDGLILIAPVSLPAHLERVARTVPTVVIGRHSRSARYDTVNDDDFTGAGLMVAHLAGLGHRRIAHIEHHETDRVRLAEMPNALRADGYRHAMLEHGLAAHIDIASTSYTRDGGHHGARILLDREHPPTAIFAGADVVALGVLDALAEAGLSVPGDISVTGYDNIALAGYRPISLTTVDQAGHRIGTTATQLLLDRIAEPGRPAVQVKLTPTPAVRATTGPPR